MRKKYQFKEDGIPCVIEPYYYERYFYIREINSKELKAGSFVSFSVYGLLNSEKAEETESFVVTTLTYEGYSVDQESSGMTIES